MPVRSIRRFLAPLLLLSIGCADDGAGAPTADLARGIAVLDGFIQPGLTLLADSGTATTRIAFGASTEFDAGAFRVRGDTAIAASSRGAGDLLYLASLTNGTVSRVQMPPRSNPGTPRFLTTTNGESRFVVPLRDSSSAQIVSVSVSGGQSLLTFSRLSGLGLCPVDVFQHGTTLWVVDANAACASNYSSRGNMRLLRFVAGTSAPQVIELTGLVGSNASVVINGSVAYIASSGDADFSTFPYQLHSSGAIATVDLVTGAVLTTRALPAGSYGASLELGRDGVLQLSLSQDLSSFRSRVISLSIPSLSATGVRVTGAEWRLLLDRAGQEVGCSAGITDAAGRLHCIQNRTGSATFLMVFAPDGSLVREVAAGQGGVALNFW